MDVFSLKRPLFGKEVEITVFDVDEFTGSEVLKAYDEGLRLQKVFNIYDKGSEISLLNKKRQLKVSPELMFVLKKALEMSRVNPKYDVTHGRSFLARKSGKDDIHVNCSYEDVHIHGSTITLNHDDVLLDLGSIAKGYIVDRICERLSSQGIESGIVDGRGDIRIFGNQEVLGIQHPREDKVLHNILLEDMSVATSGDYNQKDHIIDGQFSSVTVVTKELMIADLFATVISVSTPASIKKLLNDNKNIKAMTVDKNLKEDFYNGFEELIVR